MTETREASMNTQLMPLPPYLLRTDPMEVEDLPLQVALLTWELAQQRQEIAALRLTLEDLRMLDAIDRAQDKAILEAGDG